MNASQVQGTGACGSPVLDRHNLGQVAAALTRTGLARRAPASCRYHTLLPAEYRQPGGAATLAADRWLHESGWPGEDDEIVVINTSSRLKYLQAVRVDPVVLARGDRLPRHDSAPG